MRHGDLHALPTVDREPGPVLRHANACFLAGIDTTRLVRPDRGCGTLDLAELLLHTHGYPHR